MLEKAEKCYVVYAVTATATNAVIYYIVLEVQILPANQMYYETDFADGVFQNEAVDDYLFFEFTNTEEDQARYDSRLYDYTNYDIGNWSVNTNRNFSPTFDNDAGTMTTKTKNLRADELSGTDYYASASHYVQVGKYFMNGDFLNYNPDNTEIIMVRLKFEDMIHKPESLAAGKAARFVVTFYSASYTNQQVASCAIPEPYITNGEYVTLVLDSFEPEYFDADHINTLRFTINGAENKDANTIGKITFDYIYVGPKATAPERNSLFFDFKNDSAAQTRYASTVYGKNYNFDTGYWAPSATMNNTDGTMTVDVTYNASADNTNSTCVGVTNSAGNFPDDKNPSYAPLNYVPEDLQYVQIRLKLVDCKVVSGTKAKIALFCHYTDNGVKGNGFSPEYEFTFTNGQYFTLTLDLSNCSLQKKEILTSLAFEFRNINGNGKTGQIVFDYIFFGGKEDLPQRDSIWFDFTNERADQSRYNSRSYAYLNYDVAKWCHASNRMGTLTYNGEEGTLSATLKSLSGNTSYYVQTSPQLQTNFPMNYTPTNAEVVQLRFKLEGVERTSTTSKPFVQINAFSSLNDGGVKNSAGQLIYPNDKAAIGTTDAYYIPETHLANGEYITVTLPVRAAFKNLEKVTALRIHFGHFNAISGQTGKFTLDYFFVGTKADLATFQSGRNKAWNTIGTSHNELQELSFVEKDMTTEHVDSYMFFDMDTTSPKLRYDSHIYGGNGNGIAGDDYDYSLPSNWSKNASQITHPTIENGEMSFNVLDGVSALWLQVCPNQGRLLHHAPSATDYCYVRLKTTNMKSTLSSGLCNMTVHLWVDAKGASAAFKTTFNVAESANNYITIKIPLNASAKYLSTGVVTAMRLQWNDITPEEGLTGSFTIDHVFVGSQENAHIVLPNSAFDGVETTPNSFFVDFTNTESDQRRYRDGVAYAGVNRDVGGAWATNSYYTNPAVNTEEGTLSFTMTEKAAEDGRSGPYLQLGSGVASGFTMQYDPSQTEIIQIRFKLDDYAKTSTGASTYVRTMYCLYPSRKDFTALNSNGDKVEVISSAGPDTTYDFSQACKGYVVVTCVVHDKFRNAMITWGNEVEDKELITSLRFAFYNIKSASTTTPGTLTVDYVYAGTKEGAPTPVTYGKDSSYNDDTKLSNGSSYVVNGKGVPLMKADKTINYDGTSQYTETSFTFKGTGFDIIGRTGLDQGALRVVITDTSGKHVKTVSVLNRSEANLELYQIPVVSVNDLPYATYQAHIFVNAAYDYGNDGTADPFSGTLDRGGEFFFDAVRIYDPLGTAGNAYYIEHAEVEPTFTEIRDILIDTGNYNANGTMTGALYLETGKTGADIGTYTTVGPNNEVYLSAGQAIAFTLVAENGIPSRVDIGAKAVNGLSANLSVSVGSSAPSARPTKQAVNITSSNAQYFPIEITPSLWQTDTEGNKFVYITVYNADGVGVLSLTDVKYAYSSISSKQCSVRFVVGEDLVDYVMQSSTPVSSDLSFITSISAGAEIRVVYTVLPATVGKYDDFYLAVTKEVFGGEAVETVFYMNEGLNPIYTEDGELMAYQAVYTGINAKEMGDTFTATLFASDGDTLVRSEEVSNTIAQYLISKIDNPASTKELKTLAVDMLNYGAAAQQHLNYNTDNLVNASLTEEQLVYATQALPAAENRMSTTPDGQKLLASVSVQSKVLLYLSCEYAEQENSDLRYVVCDAQSGDVLAELSVNAIGTFWQGVYDNIGAREMRKLISATLYDGETAVSQTLTWSVESYVASVRENAQSITQLAMVDAMLIYGDSVAAYMTASGQ